MPTGRPSKFNNEIAAEIIGYIARGHNRDDAARLAGICPETLACWIRTKEDFADEVRRADCRAVDLGISALEKAMKNGNARAIQMWLQYKRPGSFTPKQQIDLGNADGKPFQAVGVDLGKLTTAQIQALKEIKLSLDANTNEDMAALPAPEDDTDTDRSGDPEPS